MSIVKNKDKRTGITYVYESESYWDKEKQQPRARRKLIGKLDEATGEIVPTDGRGHKRKKQEQNSIADTTLTKETGKEQDARLKEQDILIKQLRDENLSLKKEKGQLLKELHSIISKHEA